MTTAREQATTNARTNTLPVLHTVVEIAANTASDVYEALLTDLAKRLQSAHVDLIDLIAYAEGVGHPDEVIRLKGKAAGVSLALSYLEETWR